MRRGRAQHRHDDVDASEATEEELPVTPTLTEEQSAALSPSEVAEVDLHVLDPARIGVVVANRYATRRKQFVLALWGTAACCSSPRCSSSVKVSETSSRPRSRASLASTSRSIR